MRSGALSSSLLVLLTPDRHHVMQGTLCTSEASGKHVVEQMSSDCNTLRKTQQSTLRRRTPNRGDSVDEMERSAETRLQRSGVGEQGTPFGTGNLTNQTVHRTPKRFRAELVSDPLRGLK